MYEFCAEKLKFPQHIHAGLQSIPKQDYTADIHFDFSCNRFTAVEPANFFKRIQAAGRK